MRFLIAWGDSLFIRGHSVRRIHQSRHKTEKYHLMSCHFYKRSLVDAAGPRARVDRPHGVRLDR